MFKTVPSLSTVYILLAVNETPQLMLPWYRLNACIILIKYFCSMSTKTTKAVYLVRLLSEIIFSEIIYINITVW